MEEKFTFFWSGPFSQWESSFFTIDGTQYNCAEQYMMASKALRFGDLDSWEQIMSISDPSAQKALGRGVKGFTKESWEEIEDNGKPHCWNVVFKGSMAKFDQNPELLCYLLETDGTTIVEASPFDPIWGIGCFESAPEAQSRDTWLGKNWLGEILTEVRDDMING